MFKRLLAQAAKEKAEAEAFLAQLGALSLQQQDNMMSMLQKDKMIPHGKTNTQTNSHKQTVFVLQLSTVNTSLGSLVLEFL